MSTGDSPTKPKTVSGAKISDHARLRYLERVNPASFSPESEIREILKNGQRIRIHRYSKPVYFDGEAGVLVDEQDREVVTVLSGPMVRREMSSEQSQTDASASWQQEYQHQGVSGGGHK